MYDGCMRIWLLYAQQRNHCPELAFGLIRIHDSELPIGQLLRPWIDMVKSTDDCFAVSVT